MTFASFLNDAVGIVQGDDVLGRDVFVRDLVLGTTECVTRNASGEFDDNIGVYSMSADFRFIAFSTFSTIWGPDTNGVTDIWVRDRRTGAVQRVSSGWQGDEANGFSESPRISADGRFVAYGSAATNIVPGDTNGFGDVFVFDRVTGATQRANVATGGIQAGGVSSFQISGDGRYVVFDSGADDVVPNDTNNEKDVFVHDLWTLETRRVSVTSTGAQGNGCSLEPAISADGRYVAFVSTSTNFTPGATGNQQVYRHDLLTGLTERVSESDTGEPANAGFNKAPALSADGRYVAFQSFATNLGDPGYSGQDVYLRDMGPPVGPRVYCIAEENSRACLPAMDFAGTPSATAASGFTIGASNLLNQRPGILFYGTTGSHMLPFGGRFLCVAPPMRRTGLQTTGGSLPPARDCSGRIETDVNAWIAGGNDPTLQSGVQVWAQVWSRDPASASTTNLSDAVTFVVGP